MIMVYMNTGQNLLVGDTITSEVFMLGYSKDMWPALKQKASGDSEWIVFDVSGHEPKEIAGVVKSSGGVVLNIGGVDDTDNYIDQMGYGNKFSLVLDMEHPEATTLEKIRAPAFDDSSGFFVGMSALRRPDRFSIGGDQLWAGEDLGAFGGGDRLAYSPETETILVGRSKYRIGHSSVDGSVLWEDSASGTIYQTQYVPETGSFVSSGRDTIDRMDSFGSYIWSQNYSFSAEPYKGYLTACGIGPNNDVIYAYNTHEKQLQMHSMASGIGLGFAAITTGDIYDGSMTVTQQGVTLLSSDRIAHHYNLDMSHRWSSAALPSTGSLEFQGAAADRYGFVYAAFSGSAGVKLIRINPRTGESLDIESVLPLEWSHSGVGIYGVDVREDGLLITTDDKRIRILQMA